MTALNPVFTVGDQIAEVARVHASASRRDAWDRAVEMLDARRHSRARASARREYPHQLSGGMRQRVVIAMALVMNPALVIADEPTTALDVTIQAQILELLADLQQRLGTSILLITHDLGVVAEIASRVVVMYGGEIVEEARGRDAVRASRIIRTPRGCCTRCRASGGEQRAPRDDSRAPCRRRPRWPTGCRFRDRCPYAWERCEREHPPLYQIGAGHIVALPPRRGAGARATAASARQRAATSAPRARDRGIDRRRRRRNRSPATLPPLLSRPRPRRSTSRSSAASSVATAAQVRAVDGVSFDVAPRRDARPRRRVGCGKTTPAARSCGSSSRRRATSTSTASTCSRSTPATLRRLRRRMQIIFQDPFSSLNPRMTVGAIVREGLTIHKLAEGAAADARVRQLLDEVGLRAGVRDRATRTSSPAASASASASRARSPSSPSSSSATSRSRRSTSRVQAQVINLLQDLQRDRGLAYLFIAHDLSVVEHIADRVAVMYLGHDRRARAGDDLYREPLMPYTQALLSAVPVPDPTA